MYFKFFLVFVVTFVVLILSGIFFSSLLVTGFSSFYCLLLLSLFFQYRFKVGILELFVSVFLCFFLSILIDNAFSVQLSDFVLFPGFVHFFYALLGIIVAYLLLKKKLRIYGCLLFIVVSVYFGTYGRYVQQQWDDYICFGNFGSIKEQSIDFEWNFEFRDKPQGKNSFKDTFLVLDFWNSSCAICLREMPKWDSLAAINLNTPLLMIPVFIPRESEKKETAIGIFQRRKINNLEIALGSKKLAEQFSVMAYPTVFIIKNNKMLFKGTQEKAIDFLKRNGMLIDR